MATREDKQRLIYLARRGPMDGETGFRNKLNDMVKGGCTGPGKDYGLDFNEKPFHRTALWEATWKNNDTAIRLLVEKGATIDYPDFQGRTPLHEAAFYGMRPLVEFLLDKGHPIDCVDLFSQTPLYRATEAGRDDIVQLLFEKKAQLNVLDSDSCSVSHLAAFVGEQQMSEWLFYKGAYVNRYNLHDGEAGGDGKLGGPSPRQAQPAAGVGQDQSQAGAAQGEPRLPGDLAQKDENVAKAQTAPKKEPGGPAPQYRGREAASRAAETRAEYNDK